MMVGAIATYLFAQANVSPSWAQTGYPTASDPYLNDYAQVIRPEDAASIRQSLATLETNHGIEAVVLTINSIQDYDTGDSTIESFATNLFNSWGIGNADRNDGILTLVAVSDRNVRIEVGAGYGDSLNFAMQSIIDEYMVPNFKQNDYSSGILQGTEAIIRRVTTPEETSAQPLSPQPTSPSVSPTYETQNNNYQPWLLGGSAAGLGGIGLTLRQFFRYRRRRCPDCGKEMVRLDESSDNQYLDEGQNVEEQLGSVDYDVWQCPNCTNHDIHRYGSLFSQYKTCSQCQYKTLSSRREVIHPATYSSSGTAEVTETCQHCSYCNTYTVTIPRKERPSSGGSSGGSSSSGGGGGHSSGGGASGSW